jgi:hypothetical protein
MNSSDGLEQKRVSPTCETCGKSFIRPEHLRRHITSSHTKDRKFPCGTCGKEFVRRDALQRHTLTHQQTESSLIRRGGRACRPCSTAKARCSGHEPCSRCSQKSLECFYPNRAHERGSMDSSDKMQGPNTVDITARDESLDLPMQAHHNNSVPQEQQMPVTFEPQPFDATYWNTSLGSINWLPIDFPDYLDPSPTFDTSMDPFAWANEYAVDQAASYTTYNAQSSEAFQSTPQDPSPVSIAGPSPSDSARTRESQTGEFYVDGEPARLPRVKRRRISTRHLAPATETLKGVLSLDVGWVRSADNQRDLPLVMLDDSVYNSFCQATNYIMAASDHTTIRAHSQAETPAGIFQGSFHGSILPPKHEMEYLLRLFAKHCLPLLPIIHSSRLINMSWQVMLSAAALGAHYVEVGAEVFASSTHELVRRVLYLSNEDERWLPTNETERLQLRLFHCVGSLYCQDARLKQSGRECLLLLTSADMWRSRALRRSEDPSEHDRWQSFLDLETHRRVCHAIWLLDAQYAYQNRQQPHLSLKHNQNPLPCPASSWNAISAQAWTDDPQHLIVPSNISKTLHELYTTKTLASETQLCEFSRVLVIHGIMERTWAVATYFSDPLSSYLPSATIPDSSFSAPDKIWLPANEAFVKWRNSACDCLDVLHWAANATIGSNSGLEHPTILHLHAARVVLLTPYEAIVALAQNLAGEIYEDEETVSSHKSMIRRWVMQDQYKARLAMIHAGVSFWHVRRFSVNAWYEVDAFAFATLALWAFSAFSEGVKKNSRAASKSDAEGRARGDDEGSRSDSEEAVSDIILLDRPMDDELVQQFVRSGDKMNAHMNGVGDLYGARGAEKVLVEGKKILKSLGGWNCRERWIRVMDRLAKISRARNMDKRPAG